jgi:hypothetical protein
MSRTKETNILLKLDVYALKLLFIPTPMITDWPLVQTIEIGLEHAPFVVLFYLFFLIGTCKKPADYGPQQH